MSFLKVTPRALAELREVGIPFREGDLAELKAGDMVALSGTLYTGRDQTHRLVTLLNKKGLNVEALAGDVPQRKRLSTLNRFKDGDIPYVVATDVAGRGIHVEGVSHVINYDLPEDPEDYVHRIGRTGRAGAAGISISFVSEDDAFNLPLIEEYLGSKITCTQPGEFAGAD